MLDERNELSESRRTKVKVGVLKQRLIITLETVLSQILQIVESASGSAHLVEQCAVEREVVSAAREEVVTGKRSVTFELVVAGETRLRACQEWVDGCPCGGVAADRELGGDEVTVCLQTQEGEQI